MLSCHRGPDPDRAAGAPIADLPTPRGSGGASGPSRLLPLASTTGVSNDARTWHPPAFPGPAEGRRARPLRPGVRTRRLRGRLRRDPERCPEPQHHRPGPGGAAQPGPPGRHGFRPAHRGRGRHPPPGAGRLPARRGRLRPAGGRSVRRRPGLFASRRGRRRDRQGADRGRRRRGGPGCPRLASRAHRRQLAVGSDPPQQAAVRAPLPGRAGPLGGRHRPGPAGVRRPASGPARGRRLLRLPVGPDAGLQGDADHRAAGRRVRRAAGRADGQCAGRRPLPLLHQHLPGLGAGPPVPDDRAQRRDQHRDGQPELDAGPRGAAEVRPHRWRPGAAVPDLHPGRLGLGLVRRGGRAAAPGRPLAAARDADDDPGGLGEQRLDGQEAEGLLRLPLLPDGALGWSGGRGVHRRHPDRCGAGPQRTAPRALLGHRRRSGGAGLRGRRAGHPRR